MIVHSPVYLDNREPWIHEMVLAMDPNVFDNYAMFRALNTRLERHLRNKGFHSRCRAAAVGIKTFNDEYEVHTKVIFGNGHFIHIEPYEAWPSEELDAKIMLVLG